MDEGMDFAVLDRLVRQHSRYTLVLAAAKLARSIVEHEGERDELTGKDIKPVTVALERIASGEALVRPEPSDA